MIPGKRMTRGKAMAGDSAKPAGEIAARQRLAFFEQLPGGSTGDAA